MDNEWFRITREGYDEIKRKPHNWSFCCSLSMSSYSGWVSTEHKGLLVHKRSSRHKSPTPSRETGHLIFIVAVNFVHSPSFNISPHLLYMLGQLSQQKRILPHPHPWLIWSWPLQKTKKKKKELDGPKYSFSHWLVNLNNANKNGVNLYKHFKRAWACNSHPQMWILWHTEWIQHHSEVQAKVVLL